MSLEILAQEKVWLDKSKYADAERVYYEKLSKNKEEKTITSGGNSCATTIPNTSCEAPCKNVLIAEIEKVRQYLREKVLSIDAIDESSVICSRDTESSNTINAITDLKNAFQKLEIRVSVLEGKSPRSSSSNSSSLNQDIEQLQSLMVQLEARVKSLESKNVAQSPSKPEEKETPKKNDEDDDVDLFGSESEEESEEAARLKAQRVAEYFARKFKKPTFIAKSNIILDVKPWDDETDMKELEKAVRQVATDGLLWGAFKLVPLAYGIHKLQISCVVEDEKVSIDWLQETLQEIEDFIQSVDIAAFNKI
uniref:ACYPI006186 protein n=1 Tax=Acyrthosiphon pisum TaxID=7029 RepID=C4WSE5_ACYPI|nr:ACYPI006186 [Acyrthosiphon pisum]